MKWRDALRMPVSEAARVGAKQVARLLQTDVRELFSTSNAKAQPASAAAPSSEFAPTLSEQPLGQAAQAALAVRQNVEPNTIRHPEPQSWWNPGDLACERYEVQRVLAANTRFRVYLARHVQWNLPVILKVPGEDLAGNKSFGEQLIQAGQRWTQCGLHPHIAYCFTSHRVGQVPVLVIEYIEGGSLRQWLASGQLGSLRAQLDVAIQICHALEHAHSRALAHGGLTPENILFTPNGTVRVTDFGITQRREGYSDPYLAPETWVDDGPSDIPSDIFAFGVCLYELFCNGRPYELTRGPRRRCAEPIGRNGQRLPAPLGDLLQACVDWEPLRRPRSVRDIRLELARLREELFRAPSPFASLPPNTWDADGWNNQALVALDAGNFPDAEAALETARNIDPHHLEANFNLGVLRWHAGVGSDEAVLDALRQARAPRTQPWLPQYLSALVALESGDGARALELLQEVAPHLPGETNALEELVRAARRCRPAHSLARELQGHSQVVTAVAMTADGKWAITGADDHLLFLWDTFTGTAVRCLEGHQANITSVALTPDGQLALSGAEDGTVKLWDLARGRCTKTLQLPGKVFALAVSADGRYAVASSAGSDNFLGIDGTIVDLWDLEKERPLRRLEGHSSAVKALAMTPDGKRLVSGGDDQRVILWDLLRGQPLRAFRGHEHFVSSVALRSDGQLLLSGSWDRSVRVWDARKGQCVAELRGHTGIVTCLAMRDDGSVAVSGSWDGTLRVWDLSHYRCIRTLQGHRGMVTSVAVAASGRILISGSWDTTARLWDLPQPGPEVCVPRLSLRHEYASLPAEEASAEERAALAQAALCNGDLASAVGAFNEELRHSVCTDSSVRELFRALQPHSEIAGVEVAEPLGSRTLDAPLVAAAYDSETECWFVASTNGSLLAMDTELQKPASSYKVETDALCALALHPHGGLGAVAGFNRTLYVFRSSAPDTPARLEGHRSIVSTLAMGGNGTVVSGSYDHTVRVWDLRTSSCSRIFPGHERQVTTLAVSPDGSIVASGDLGGTVIVWNAATGSTIHRWNPTNAAVSSLCFAAQGELVVAGDVTGMVRVWNLRSGRCQSECVLHEGAITKMLALWNDAWLVSGSVDGLLRAWRAEEPTKATILFTAPGAITALAQTADGAALLVADASARATLLPLAVSLSRKGS